MRDAGMFTADAQTSLGSKAESLQQHWNSGKFTSKKIERGMNVVLLTPAAIVNAGAESCAAEIESQNRNPAGVQRVLLGKNYVSRASWSSVRQGRIRSLAHRGEETECARRLGHASV